MTRRERPAFEPSIDELLQQAPLAPLGPGSPVRAMRPKLDAAALPSGDATMAAACRAGLYLAFNFLDESHAISQEVDTAEGSYWHAILHRREPDPANSKYWFRRVGAHPVFAELAKAAAELGYPATGALSPFDFVDACERARGTGGADEELCRRVQRAEWELLFDYCYRRAAGT